MLIKKINNHKQKVTIYKDELDKIDINNEHLVSTYIEKIIIKLLNNTPITGIMFLDIYIDANYGIIILSKTKEIPYKNNIDIKITFNIDTTFLYEIDYYYKDTISYNNYNIYYYKEKYYLELLDTINEKDYLNLLENSILILDNNNITSKGIKIKI